MCSLVSEFNSPQSLIKPLLYQSAPGAGGIREGVVLEDRPELRGDARRAGVQKAAPEDGAGEQQSEPGRDDSEARRPASHADISYLLNYCYTMNHFNWFVV